MVFEKVGDIDIVTIILVNYFTQQLIIDIIENLKDEKEIKEIIVVDNSSSFPPLEQIDCHTLRVILPNENLGFGKACNLALSQASGKYIFLLNPDTYLHKGSIHKMVDLLESDQMVGAVSPYAFWDKECTFYLPPSQMQSPIWELLNAAAFRIAIVRKLLTQNFFKKTMKMIQNDKPLEQEMLSGGHIMIRKDMLKTIGTLFDENFFMYYEDTDFCIRARSNGYKLILLPQAKVTHFWSNDVKKYTFQDSSKNYFFQKHYKFLTFFKFLRGIVEKLALREPQNYKDLGERAIFPDIDSYINTKLQATIEIGFHYTFVPAIVTVLKPHEKFNSDKIAAQLRSGEHWIRIRQADKIDTFRCRLSINDDNIAHSNSKITKNG